ncbi:MAG: hypothetical protein O3C27_12950 [Actinomycetota bacterium]|nr:hypothetical protein [Actinomycetota bacterium]
MKPFGPRSLDGGLDPVPVDGRGTLWLCGKHVVGPDPDAALVRAAGSGLIVCLNERHEIDDRYPGYVRWLRSEERRGLWHPIPDLHAPTVEEITPVVDRIVEALPHGVIIHCGAGIGRAPTVAICTLIRVGYQLDEALTLVADRRPMAGPESGAQRTLVEDFADSFPRTSSRPS